MRVPYEGLRLRRQPVSLEKTPSPPNTGISCHIHLSELVFTTGNYLSQWLADPPLIYCTEAMELALCGCRRLIWEEPKLCNLDV